MRQSDLFIQPKRPWNAGRLIGPKAPLKPKHIWAIRQQLKVARRVRDLAMFNCALDSKLRACDLVRLRVSDVEPGGALRQRSIVIQQKTGRLVPFEITVQPVDCASDLLKTRPMEVPMFLSSAALAFALSAQPDPGQPLYPRIRLQEYLPPIIDGDRAASGNVFDFVQAGGEDALPITPPQVEMRAREDMRPISLSVAFNWVWLGEGRDRRPVWFARLRAAIGDRSIERFADSRDCPGVEQSLAQLDGLPTIDTRVPSLPDPAVTTIPDFGGYLHDNTYDIRLGGLFGGETYTDRVEVSGGSSTPLAQIVAESLTRLLPCWTDIPPPRS